MEEVEVSRQLRQEKLDLEQSNFILRKLKRIYYKTSQVECSGCKEMFDPVAFKGHVFNCRQLDKLEG